MPDLIPRIVGLALITTLASTLPAIAQDFRFGREDPRATSKASERTAKSTPGSQWYKQTPTVSFAVAIEAHVGRTTAWRTSAGADSSPARPLGRSSEDARKTCRSALIASAILMSAIERKCARDRPDADVLRRATAPVADGASEAAKRWRQFWVGFGLPDLVQA
jgi:hypothetical protein